MTRICGLEPWANPQDRVLILGSMPSLRSLQERCYYAHPRNRFWPIIELLCGRRLPDLPSRRQALSQLRIALYDVICSCERKASADHTIRQPQLSNIPGLLARCPGISLVLTNGSLASGLYSRHFAALQPLHLALPSTSPANARYSLQQLAALYAQALCPIAGLPLPQPPAVAPIKPDATPSQPHACVAETCYTHLGQRSADQN